MTTMWTTSQRPRGWPVHGFQARMLAIILGITTTIAVWIYQPKYQWTAIERHYLTPYMLVSAGWFEKYAVLHTVDAKRQIASVDAGGNRAGRTDQCAARRDSVSAHRNR